MFNQSVKTKKTKTKQKTKTQKQVTSLRMRDHTDNDLTLPGVTEQQEATFAQHFGWHHPARQRNKSRQLISTTTSLLPVSPRALLQLRYAKFVGMCGWRWTAGGMAIDDRVEGKNRGTETLFGWTEIYWERALKRAHVPNVSLLICSINPASDALSSLLGPGLVILWCSPGERYRGGL